MSDGDWQSYEPGSGYGYGSGSGDGSGSGYGYGDGSGDGSGSGSGDGSGSGSGSGYGDGSWSGYGDGSWSGYVPHDSPIMAWHYVPADGRIRFDHDGSRPRVEPGLVLDCDPDRLEMCHYGLHASMRQEDALSYALNGGYDGILCRVALSGRVLFGGDKICAERREVIELIE